MKGEERGGDISKERRKRYQRRWKEGRYQWRGKEGKDMKGKGWRNMIKEREGSEIYERREGRE